MACECLSAPFLRRKGSPGRVVGAEGLEGVEIGGIVNIALELGSELDTELREGVFVVADEPVFEEFGWADEVTIEVE